MSEKTCECGACEYRDERPLLPRTWYGPSFGAAPVTLAVNHGDQRWAFCPRCGSKLSFGPDHEPLVGPSYAALQAVAEKVRELNLAVTCRHRPHILIPASDGLPRVGLELPPMPDSEKLVFARIGRALAELDVLLLKAQPETEEE